MNIIKYSINQKVTLSLYNNWIGDYDVTATIVGYSNVVLNGKQTYIVKTFDGITFNEVQEDLLSNEKED